MALDIGKIIQLPLPEICYNKVVVPKNGIVIHHTAGAPDPRSVIAGWKTRTDKVCTPFVIAGKSSGAGGFNDGDIFQTFPSKYWSYHLGLDPKHFAPFGLPYKQLNSPLIAIEVCNWGFLTKDTNGNYKNYVGGIVPADEVVTLDTPYRGYTYYHKYTDAQITSLRDLILYLCMTYNIPTTYHTNMFDVNKDALMGTSGIWTHTSFRTDKWDMAPQKNLIAMLQSLNQAL